MVQDLVNELDQIARARSGDRAALEDLLLAHCSFITRHIGPKIPASVRGVLSVDDVLQQTFLEAFRSVYRFQPRTPNSFRVWLKTIADCQLQNMVKALTRKKRGGEFRAINRAGVDGENSLVALVEVLSGKLGTPSAAAIRREAIQAVQVGIAGLPDDQRTAIQMRYLEGKSLDQTAARMGRTPSAVRSLIHRAKQRLRETLGRSSRWFNPK